MKLASSTYPVIAVCLFWTSASAEPKGQIPSAISVLTGVVQAHKHIGPVTRTFTITTIEKGKPLPISITGSQRLNDERHCVTRAQMRSAGMVLQRTSIYRSGAKEIWFDEIDRTYKNQKPGDPGKSGPILTAIKETLAHPKDREQLATAPVKLVPMGDGPAWRVAWREASTPEGMQGPVQAVVIVGRADSLIRKYTLTDRNGFGISVEWLYRHHKAPFPSQTFRFTPPPGAKAGSP